MKKYNSIILLAFNRKQQDYIREQIALLSPKIFEVLEDQVILRNIENIQGDEAELVIASIGYTAKTSLFSTYIGSKKGRNALNVAITRAKDKMIIIKSISSNDIDPKNENLLTFKR
nr:AAA domain-containing protein [Mycoplasma phocoeninasale]